MSANFHHITPIEVRFADMDAMGHVNNANYLTYVEIARINYFNTVLSTGIDFSKQGFILARATVDFLLPIEQNDKIQVATRCSRIGTKSFDLEYEIVKTNHQPPAVAAKATTVLVGYDYHEKKTVVIPQEWKKELRSMRSDLTPPLPIESEQVSHAIPHGSRRERESKDLFFSLEKPIIIPLPSGEGQNSAQAEFRVRSLGRNIILLIILSISLSSCSYFNSSKLVNGSSAPEISMPDTSGQTLTLSSLRGNLVLLEFWASWCRPCREENPKLVKLYNKYKDTEFQKAKSLKVISISLDSEKDKWLEAIGKDSLLLEYHLSDLQGWNSAAVDSYQFKSIPASFLVDQNGIIIGKNLKPRDLDKLLSTLAKQ